MQSQMLFCPEQGGWHSGTWFQGRWLDFLTLQEELFPSYYAEMLPDPEDEASGSGDRPGLWVLSEWHASG